jgi:putative ATP-dependent endonuclease of OLD family
MRVIKVKINNYRNLNGSQIVLNPDINFLVGENDTGKSNFLDMLNFLMNRRSFLEDDFYDKTKPIEVQFSLKLSEAEKGIFDDCIDPNQNDMINLIARQDSYLEEISYKHIESDTPISYMKFRCVNFIKYDSLRNPKDEITFYKGRGVGKFLAYLVNRFTSEDTKISFENIISKESVKPIVDYINEKLKNLRVFEEFMMCASIEEELTDLIHRILTIKDSKGFEIEKIGHGVQFSFLIELYILQNLMKLIEDRRRDHCIFSHNDKRNISIILGLDEPEIHLHPYMQRSLVKYINNLVHNKAINFSNLAKELFEIDGMDGQAIIVTHSPNILLNNYKYLARFYLSESKIAISSGEQLDLKPDAEKHLFKNFIYIKEAFFSRCVIIVEGETEFGALPIWAEKVVGDLDKFGISVINAGGAGGVPPTAYLLSDFEIPNVSIVDKDQYESQKTNYDSITNLRLTDCMDFEEEIVDNLIAIQKINLLFEIVNEHDYKGLDRYIQRTKLSSIATKYGISQSWDDKDHRFSEISQTNNNNLKKTMFLSWLNIEKSITLGRIIGEKLRQEEIPQKYKETIEEAKSLSK